MVLGMNKRGRSPFALAVLMIIGLLSFAAYLQAYQGVTPCPLCILQRIIYAILAGVFALACLHNPKKLGRSIYYGSASLVAIAGCLVAGRHIWIENLPKNLVPSCGPSWDVLVENFPLHEVLTVVLRGSGDCANIAWKFMGLSIADWSLAWFMFLALFAIAGLITTLRTHEN